MLTLDKILLIMASQPRLQIVGSLINIKIRFLLPLYSETSQSYYFGAYLCLTLCSGIALSVFF